MKNIKFWEILFIFAKLLGSNIYGVIFMAPSFLNGLKKSKRNYYFLLFIAISPLILSLLTLKIEIIQGTLSNLLFYLSVLLIYPVYLKKEKRDLLFIVDNLIKIQFIFNFIEFILLNTPLGELLWYFPADHPHRALVLGLQKSLGLSSLSSPSGYIAVFLLIIKLEFGDLSNSRSMILYTLLSVLLLMSGTGFFLLLLYAIYKLLNSNFKSNLTIIVPLIGILLVLSNFSDVNKFSIDYFIEIVYYKIMQIDSEVSLDYYFEILFGRQLVNGEVFTSGDFGYLNIFISMGFYGLCILFFLPFVLFKERKYPLSILVLTSMYHYPALAGGIGGMAYALALAISRK